MFLQNHFQNAYVTHDLDKAVQNVKSRYGVLEWNIVEPDMILKTPTGDKPAKVRAAFGWAGMLQFELIQPVSGYVDHYLKFLPNDKTDASLRFHHICMRRDNLDEMRAEIARLGLPLTCEGSVEGLVFIYLDGRATFGHYVEYLWATPEMWAWQGWPAARPIL